MSKLRYGYAILNFETSAREAQSAPFKGGNCTNLASTFPVIEFPIIEKCARNSCLLLRSENICKTRVNNESEYRLIAYNEALHIFYLYMKEARQIH